MHTFQFSQVSYRWEVIRSLFEKCVQENFVHKETCVLKKIESKLNFEHLFELATLFSDAASINQCSNSVTSTFVQ